MSSHKITLRQPQGVDVPFHSELHDSLLEALEDSQIAAEYQCREGYCGSCRVTLLTGKVAYRCQPLAFINKGEILPCCCHPLSDIEIE
ncbi:class I ribonucleotide reductase maintenance protein YfaE [Moellerella wisconsensis]|uniref:Ferredoxin n=1 Tax=Moellerella wisconsensis ATCC 35017 TaxID=1354267 RepID=A0A0N0I9U9_9GAMM|nr:class I ribonucleotide reductase maintenance protein YfaE [Moellerella wisconsensis]KPD02493.1 ferredoxin [Moellerella wisconsensis ATCC 35017]VFS47961.1 CDP-6-deoxy-L-threo-D-glycero-4-hexulose-3-dehydrase reductase [Moellerella wisconsensis]